MSNEMFNTILRINMLFWVNVIATFIAIFIYKVSLK